MKVSPLFSFISIFLLSLSTTVSTQNYFKLVDSPMGSYYQGIAAFPNGDVLLADRIHDEIQPFAAKGAYLIRLDECGEIVWSKTYQNNGWIFSFEQMDISEQGEIFILGNWYSGNIFNTAVLKLNSEGDFLAFKTFDIPDVMFHNNYDIEVKDNRITVFSFLKTTDGISHNHIFTLDNDLDWIWNKKISPYEAFGEYTMTDDLGLFYQTGNSFIKLNAAGEVEWAKRVESPGGFYLFSQPLAVSDGYIIGIYSPNAAYFFFKLDLNGNLVWQSQEFPAFYHVPELKMLENGHILVTYNNGTPTANVPYYLTISPTGELSSQRRLNIDFFLNTGFTYPTLTTDGRVNIFGNAQMAFTLDNHFKDFILQFDINNPDSDCYNWEVLDEAADHDFEVVLNPLTVTGEDIELLVETHNSLNIEEVEVIFNEICPVEPAVEFVFSDTLLHCSETWTITLPDEDFIWQDGNTDNPRDLEFPGIYTATKTNCLEDLIYEYELKKNECDCDIFIPNVFSPNQDGIHDELVIYSNCEIVQLKTEVYSRWGSLIFSSQSIDQFWEGTADGKTVDSGVYVLKMTAQVQDGIGEVYEFERFQAVTVL